MDSCKTTVCEQRACTTCPHRGQSTCVTEPPLSYQRVDVHLTIEAAKEKVAYIRSAMESHHDLAEAMNSPYPLSRKRTARHALELLAITQLEELIVMLGAMS